MALGLGMRMRLDPIHNLGAMTGLGEEDNPDWYAGEYLPQDRQAYLKWVSRGNYGADASLEAYLADWRALMKQTDDVIKQVETFLAGRR